jgi:hypothetical protein
VRRKGLHFKLPYRSTACGVLLTDLKNIGSADLQFKLTWIHLSTKGLTRGFDALQKLSPANRITLAGLWNARAAEVNFTL